MSFWLGQLSIFGSCFAGRCLVCFVESSGCLYTMRVTTTLKAVDLSCFLFCYKLVVVVFQSKYFIYVFPGKIVGRCLL